MWGLQYPHIAKNIVTVFIYNWRTLLHMLQRIIDSQRYINRVIEQLHEQT